MAIKAVIFDCFGVLVISARNQLIHKYPELKTQIDDIMHQSDYGIISTQQQTSKMLMDLLKVDAKRVEQLFWDVSVRDEAAIDWARDVKKLGRYKIGMLSNVGNGLFAKFFDEADQKAMFDEVVLSCQEGIAKPEVAIFELTAARLGVKPSECVMIDDTPLNIEAATNIGMQGIRFISLDQARRDLNSLLESDNA